MIFKGSATALITPFTESGVDFDAYEKLLNFQIENGTDALVVLGTTGEPATMSAKEKDEVIKLAVKTVKGRVPVIVGTGSNSTAQAVENSKNAEKLGADALLVVTPYYNKATQNGLIAHYSEIAKNTGLEIICYNVPGRTGVNMLPKTFARLSEDNKNVVAIKEASGNMEQIEEAIRLTSGSADVYSGDDGLTVPVIAMGGQGIISVASNVIPKYVSDMCKSTFGGDFKKAAKMQLDMLPFVKALFMEVNPIPVKKMAEIVGLCQKYVRLPLTEMLPENAEILKSAYNDLINK
ncbi:MAG: 4-hydroxy-tetrahydrodipicolinate synthase [Christensenellales bacterium]